MVVLGSGGIEGANSQESASIVCVSPLFRASIKAVNARRTSSLPGADEARLSSVFSLSSGEQPTKKDAATIATPVIAPSGVSLTT
ncbi:hypothetical protein BFL43_14440 [Williamsia sp. 1135]|nr:hypothetical protein BFL43_14440 [Williamsia sp. 1135]